MKTKISLNREQQVYIIPYDLARLKGYTCLGFQYAFEKAKSIAQWLAKRGVMVIVPNREHIGTIRGYREYEATVMAARIHFQRTNEKCPVELCPALIGLEGIRVEVVDSGGERRRFYVGKSTGWIPCHLEIARIDSSGGFPVTGIPFRTVRVIQTVNRRY